MYISVVIPVLNERDNARLLAGKLIPILETETNGDYQVVFVDDGSTDGTFAQILQLHAENPRIEGISFSKNFGHQLALLAGLKHSRGEAVVTMDGDLQHPPEFIPALLAKYREGYDIVNTRRIDEKEAGFFKKTSSQFFYKLINLLSDTYIEPAAADFRLMNRKTVEAFLSMPERDRFTRGLVSWMGFRQAIVPYQAQPRASGRSKYSLKKMIRFALNGITSFSSKPLTISFYTGVAISLFGFFYAIFAVVQFFQGHTIQGWTSILLTLLIIGGVILINLGIIGEYLARIYNEVKARPPYFIKDQTPSANDEPSQEKSENQTTTRPPR
jgi:polyisoprenyl-phosphate glycosyltransferase